VRRGLTPKCDAEAVRVVKNMPKWIPATYLGEAVERKFYLPFSFFKKE
jgi:protein TonB